jgi:hypothetical protein
LGRGGVRIEEKKEINQTIINSKKYFKNISFHSEN